MEKYKPFPLIVRKNKAIMPSTEKDILAMTYGSSDKMPQRFFETSETELAKCQKFDNNYFCRNKESFSTNKMKTCIGALHAKDLKSVKQNCIAKDKSDSEHAMKIDVDTWLVYAAEKTTYKSVCKDKTTKGSLNGTNYVRLPADCTFHFGDQFFQYTPDHLATFTNVMVENWEINENLTEPINETYPVFIDEKLESLRNNLTLVQSSLDKLYITPIPQITSIWTYIYWIGGIIGSLALVVGLCCCIMQCKTCLKFYCCSCRKNRLADKHSDRWDVEMQHYQPVMVMPKMDAHLPSAPAMPV